MKPTTDPTSESGAKPATAPSIAALPAPVPNPVAELNETKRELAKTQTLLKRSRDELGKALAHLRRIEENPLVMVLANLDAGSVLHDAGGKLTSLVALVRQRQGKGVFTFQVAIKPFKGDALEFVPKVKVSEPAEEVAKGVFYANDAGSLSRQDPRQRELQFSRGDRSAVEDAAPYRDEEREVGRRNAERGSGNTHSSGAGPKMAEALQRFDEATQPLRREGVSMSVTVENSGNEIARQDFPAEPPAALPTSHFPPPTSEDSEDDLRRAQEVINDLVGDDKTPTVTLLQSRMRGWGFQKATRVLAVLWPQG